MSIPEVRRRKAIANFFIGKIKHTVKRVRKEDPKK